MVQNYYWLFGGGHVPPAVRCFNQRRPIASGTGTCLVMFTWLTLQTSFLNICSEITTTGLRFFFPPLYRIFSNKKKQIKLDRTQKTRGSPAPVASGGRNPIVFFQRIVLLFGVPMETISDDWRLCE
jgi:hypothetical protein